METDPYFELVKTQFDKILMVYQTFSELKPIIEFDVVDQKLYSYPANDYIRSLPMAVPRLAPFRSFSATRPMRGGGTL